MLNQLYLHSTPCIFPPPPLSSIFSPMPMITGHLSQIQREHTSLTTSAFTSCEGTRTREDKILLMAEYTCTEKKMFVLSKVKSIHDALLEIGWTRINYRYCRQCTLLLQCKLTINQKWMLNPFSVVQCKLMDRVATLPSECSNYSLVTVLMVEVALSLTLQCIYDYIQLPFSLVLYTL